MLKRLHILILKSFLGPFILTFFLVIFILVMQFLFRYINDLIGKGLEFLVLLEFLLYTSASMVPMALPLALLMAALMTFGNLGENYELTALKSSGISLQRIMMPLILVTILISIGAFFFSNYMLPVANLKMRSLLYDIQRKKPELQIVEGVFYNGIEGYSIRIGKKDYRTNMLYDILVYDHTNRTGNTSVTYADSGLMQLSADEIYLVITLYDGHSYTELETEKKNRRDFTYPHRRDRFTEETVLIEMSGFGLDRTDESLFRSNFSMMSLAQLYQYEDSLDREINQLYSTLNRNLVEGTFYNYRRPGRPPADSSARADNVPVILSLDTDSLYRTLPVRQKKQLVSQSLNTARSSMNYISGTFLNSDGKVDRLRRYQIEIQRKFTLSFACFIFFFIGAPLGAIIRKGGLGMPTVISILFFLLYYIISLSGEKFARESMITAFQGMWISAILLLPIGIFLTYKAATDSTLMSLETYALLLRKNYRRLKYFLARLGLRT
jgi:lipopolysaccharide export system permease protein